MMDKTSDKSSATKKPRRLTGKFVTVLEAIRDNSIRTPGELAVIICRPKDYFPQDIDVRKMYRDRARGTLYRLRKSEMVERERPREFGAPHRRYVLTDKALDRLKEYDEWLTNRNSKQPGAASEPDVSGKADGLQS